MSIKCQSIIWEHSKQAGSNLLCMLAIADFADDDGRAFPSYNTLSAKTRISRRAIIGVVKKLCDSGELKVVKRTRDDNSHTSNMFHIMLENILNPLMHGSANNTPHGEHDSTRLVNEDSLWVVNECSPHEPSNRTVNGIKSTPIHEMMRLWCLSWEAKFGAKYDVHPGDAATVKRLLNTMSPTDVMAVAEYAWDHPKKWECQKCTTIKGLGSQINAIRALMSDHGQSLPSRDSYVGGEVHW